MVLDSFEQNDRGHRSYSMLVFPMVEPNVSVVVEREQDCVGDIAAGREPGYSMEMVVGREVEGRTREVEPCVEH